MSVCSVGSRTPSRRIFNSVCVCVCARRCMTLPSAARAVGETCLHLWGQTGQSECSTSGTWSTAPSSMKTLSTTLSSASAGISKTPTIWPQWPWMAWRCILLCFLTRWREFRLTSNVLHIYASGGHPGCPCAVHTGSTAQQPSRLCQRHRLGASFLVSHLHSR